MRVQLHLCWFRGKFSLTWTWCGIRIFCVKRADSQLSSGAPSKGAAVLCVGCDPKQIHLVPVILSKPAPQVLPVGHLCFTYPCVGHALCLVRLGSLCFPLTELRLFCLPVGSDLKISRFKKSLKGVPSMCCEWFICRSRDTEEKSSQIMYGKGFVALCFAAITSAVSLWKMSLQYCVIGGFQNGAQNLEIVTFQNSESYQIMRRVARCPRHLSAGSILGCSTVHRARASDFF